ncbi:hypothetical protein AB1E18_008598 [Capra hircus]
MKASEEKQGKKDENRPKPVFQESSLYPNLVDLETELFPPPYADPYPPLLPQDLYLRTPIGKRIITLPRIYQRIPL